jgi:hypothetical protein
MDFWNIKIWDNISTNVISKKIILTLFQCAAKLYEDKIHVKEAVDLIKSKGTRAILSLGIQDILSQVICRNNVNYQIRHSVFGLP